MTPYRVRGSIMFRLEVCIGSVDIGSLDIGSVDMGIRVDASSMNYDETCIPVTPSYMVHVQIARLPCVTDNEHLATWLQCLLLTYKNDANPQISGITQMPRIQVRDQCVHGWVQFRNQEEAEKCAEAFNEDKWDIADQYGLLVRGRGTSSEPRVIEVVARHLESHDALPEYYKCINNNQRITPFRLGSQFRFFCSRPGRVRQRS